MLLVALAKHKPVDSEYSYKLNIDYMLIFRIKAFNIISSLKVMNFKRD